MGLILKYLFSNLYNELTVRDDFQLIIVSLIKDATDTDKNYIVVNKKGLITVIINKFKTSEKFGQIVVKLSVSLSKMIRGYIQREKLEVGNSLFGDKNCQILSANQISK